MFEIIKKNVFGLYYFVFHVISFKFKIVIVCGMCHKQWKNKIIATLARLAAGRVLFALARGTLPRMGVRVIRLFPRGTAFFALVKTNPLPKLTGRYVLFARMARKQTKRIRPFGGWFLNRAKMRTRKNWIISNNAHACGA